MVMYGSKNRGCITPVHRIKIKSRFSHFSHCFKRLFPSPGHEAKWLKQQVVQEEMVLMMIHVPCTFLCVLSDA